MQSPDRNIEPGQEVDFQGQQDKRSHGSSRSRDRNQKKKYQREDSRSNSGSQNRARQKQTRSPQSRSMQRSEDQSLGEDNGFTIYFSNLDPKLKEDDLKKYFKKYGSLEQLDIIRYPYTNESRGYGFVQFENKDEGLKCLSELNGKDINGFKIKLEKAKRRLARQKTPGQYLGYNPPRQTNRYYRRSPHQDRYGGGNRYRNYRRHSRSRSHSHGRRRYSRSRSQERRRYHHQDRSRYQQDRPDNSRERQRSRGDIRERRDSFRQRDHSSERKQDRSNERDRTRQQQYRSKDRSQSPKKQYSRN